MSARSDANCTSFKRSCLPLLSSKCSSSKLRSKWSSIARLLRPVMMRMSSSPALTASSTTYWIAGLSTTGSISFGELFVAGRNRVPRPAAGMTALRTRVIPASSGGSSNAQIDLLTPEQPANVGGVTKHDQHSERAHHRHFPSVVPEGEHSDREQNRRQQRGERRLVQYPGDEEPEHAEPHDDQRIQHDERTAPDRHAFAALAIQRQRVADDRGDAQDACARPTADHHA